MAFIDELTRRISSEVHRNLDQAIRQAVESYVIGEGRAQSSVQLVSQKRRSRRGGKSTSRVASAKLVRDRRNRSIIDAVSRLREASIDDVARATGLDKRGIGSSLHYLAQAGKLKRSGEGRYRVARLTRAA